MPGGGFHPDRVNTFRQLNDRLFSLKAGCIGNRGRSLDAGMINSGGVQSTTSDAAEDLLRFRSTGGSNETYNIGNSQGNLIN